jgi:hypothetical protein
VASAEAGLYRGCDVTFRQNVLNKSSEALHVQPIVVVVVVGGAMISS